MSCSPVGDDVYIAKVALALQVKFTKTNQGLYAYMPPIKKRNNKIAIINSFKFLPTLFLESKLQNYFFGFSSKTVLKSIPLHGYSASSVYEYIFYFDF